MHQIQVNQNDILLIFLMILIHKNVLIIHHLIVIIIIEDIIIRVQLFSNLKGRQSNHFNWDQMYSIIDLGVILI